MQDGKWRTVLLCFLDPFACRRYGDDEITLLEFDAVFVSMLALGSV